MDPNAVRPNTPAKPGVYLFKDQTDRVIYVGKAKNLKKRVLTYFKPFSELPHKTALMMKNAHSIDHIITATENEAFILENTLIKKHMPRYNIIFQDDKQYPCLRLTIKEPYPRLQVVRRIKKDGALYFGPFSSALSMRRTLQFIDRTFQLRKCRGSGLTKRTRPCLNGQLGRCLGPCSHDVPTTDYGLIVQHVRLFLEGRNPTLLRQLKADMASASERLHFEEAARIRDMIHSIEKTIERQDVVSSKLEDQDVIGIAHKDGVFQLVILIIRKGYLMGSRNYVFREKHNTPSEILEAFLKQYYTQEGFIPKQILIPDPIEDLTSIIDWLSDLAGKRVAIHQPQKGDKYRVCRLAVSNAEDLLNRKIPDPKKNLIEQAKSVLNLRKMPISIEGLDISNLYGDQPVGAVVSFVDGLPFRSGYRNYRIKKVDNVDDYGMMSELVSRRLSRGNLPDLFLVDGGKGHLMAVLRTMRNFPELTMPEVVAIAKAHNKGSNEADKIYLPGRKNPLSLRQDHPVLLLLMHIRDEAHRRAIRHHRGLRARQTDVSELDRVPGVGPKRKKIVLGRFGSLAGVLNASIEDIASLPGMTHSVARSIKKVLGKHIEK
jgi:excinuclease ABC subunit C